MSRRAPLRFAPFLILVVLVASRAEAQCAVAFSDDIIPLANYADIARVLTGSPSAVVCTAGMGGPDTRCYVNFFGYMSYSCPNTMGCRAFFAGAGMVTASPMDRKCSWMCSPCGLIVIDNSNGLPVELMEFVVEGSGEPEESAEGEPEEYETDDG